MARLSQIDIDTLSLKAGFIKVVVKDGYEEHWVSVNDVIKELMELREENECRKISENEKALCGDQPGESCKEGGADV